METRKKIGWCPSKTFTRGGQKYVINLCVSLDDDSKNGHCDFSITSDVFRVTRNGTKIYVSGGCNHEEIVKHFPALKKFIPLHLSTHEGTPMYPVENGIYFLAHSTNDATKKYLRCTDDELAKLFLAKDDKLYFKYQLFALGIVARWKREADEFIAFIEEKSGYKWENPYTQETERSRLTLTDDERSEVEKNIANGYYSPAALEERRQQALLESINKERAKVLEEYAKNEEKARNERDVKLYILDCGLSLDNVIYYTHSNKVVFNWMSHRELITQEQYDNFVSNADLSKLPNDITFELGNKAKE
jgi:hypothetical protein